MSRPNVLVTGATGFVGGAVLAALAPRAEVRALVRRPVSASDGVDRVIGDLSAPSSLAAACAGVRTVIHAASYVGSEVDRCWAVNARGTAALVRAARRAGVERIIYVSTASVYGPGPHRDLDPDGATRRPRSAASASRLAAEEAVRAAGGWVVRPHLIYGPGDRWFVPGLVALLRQLGNWLDCDGPCLSTVSVADLARALGALRDLSASELAPGAVLHVNHPVPVRIRTMIETVGRGLGVPPPARPMSAERAQALVRERGGDPHHVAMLSTDHWYESATVWRLTGLDPGPWFPTGFFRSADWYRRALGLP
jgi:nucleoside-diphosphate-sugar epimerase